MIIINKKNQTFPFLFTNSSNGRSFEKVRLSNENGDLRSWAYNGEEWGEGKVKSYQPSALGSSGQRKFKREKWE